MRLHLQLLLQDVQDEAGRDGGTGVQELQKGRGQGEDRGEGATVLPGKLKLSLIFATLVNLAQYHSVLFYATV